MDILGAHATGMDILGTDDEPASVPMHVSAVNVPVYPVNMMAADRPGSDLGDPATMLQMGDLVDAIGPSVKNPTGAPYTPVKVRGRDGVFWVRSTSVAPNAVPSQGGPQALVRQSASPPGNKKKFAWWQIALAALGVGVVGVGIHEATK